MGYDPNSLEASRPIVERDGGIELTIYGQDDELQTIVIPDTRFNRQLVVWCRKFDRQSAAAPTPPTQTGEK